MSGTREFLRQTKIGEDDVTIGANEDVLWLKITIDNACCVKAFYTLNLEE
jgi:hypothetical protein